MLGVEMVKIRLARGGRKAKPVYTIVASDARSPRDGRYLQKLGQYNPSAKTELIDINTEAITKWVGNGAQLTDTVNSLFKKHGIKY